MPARTPGPPPAASTQSGYRIRTGQQIVGLVYSNQAFTLFGRFSVVYDDGTVDLWPVIEVASGSSRAPVVWDTGQIALKDGYVIGGAIIGRSLPSQRGQAFVQGFITDANASPGATSDQILSGYLYTGHAVVLGERTEPGPAGGHGQIVSAGIGAPAAGADYADQAVPNGAIWRLSGFRGQLVTAATAANREFSILYADATGVFGGNSAAELQTATLTEDYVALRGIVSSGVSASLAGGVISIGAGDILIWGANGDLIRFKTYNIQGTDQWSVGRFKYEEWVMPN